MNPSVIRPCRMVTPIRPTSFWFRVRASIQGMCEALWLKGPFEAVVIGIFLATCLASLAVTGPMVWGWIVSIIEGIVK